jgi:hypothetical protein
LAAAHTWAATETAAVDRIGIEAVSSGLLEAPAAPEPSTADGRAWARRHNIAVPERGRLRPEVWQAWRTAASSEYQP